MNESSDKPSKNPPGPGRDRARALRRSATEAEKKLWWHLRRKLPLEGTYFRRQVPLGPYFADFACLKHRLVIELDGGQHTTPEAQRRNAERTRFLEAQGFRVLRFWNDQVFSEIESVIETIHAAVKDMATLTPDPSLPLRGPQGRGEAFHGSKDAAPSVGEGMRLADQRLRSSPQGRGESNPDQVEAEALMHALVGRLEAGAPSNVALMHLLMEAASPEAAAAALDQAEGLAGPDQIRDKVQAVAGLMRANPNSWRAVHAVTSSVAHEASMPSPEGALAYWGDAFDRLAENAPEAGVALYALGNPDLLAAATNEVVDRLADWAAIGPATDVLDLGCGIGRFAAAMAPRVRSVLGLDLSAQMVAEARRRCTAPNVRFAQGSGRDLSIVETASIDLVLAADVFPYLVQAGGRLADDHIEEAARVLRPGGSLVILNYSYRGDPSLDSSDVDGLAETCGFTVVRLGTQEFQLWDAAVFHLVR